MWLFRRAGNPFARPCAALFRATPLRTFSSCRARYASGPRYNRFSNRPLPYDVYSVLQNPRFRLGVAVVTVAGGAFYVTHLETVPVSGRVRFNFITEKSMKKMLDKDFVKLLAQMGNPIVPSSDKRVKRVQNVVDQLISSTNLPGMQWELTLIESKETNAFVTPSGHICVFTGILPLLKDDDMLAAVIGHEIGHVIAGHARESMISMDATVPTWDLVMNRPGSRLHESEADYIGLMLMAEACFDPAAAPKVWVTMGKATGKEPPQFLSTHPSHGARRERLLEWLPKARDKAAASDCGKISNLTVPFYQAAKDSSEEIW